VRVFEWMLRDLTGLTFLELNQNKLITDDCVKKLTNLRKLDINHNRVITSAGIMN